MHLTEEQNILTVKDLDVFYRKESGRRISGKNKYQVLKDVSFQMKRGEILGLVGESGCGKSTLAKTILGIVKQESGEINHSPSPDKKEDYRPQMIFQDPYSSLNPVKKVGWILEEPLRSDKRITKSQRQEKVYQMLQKVGLEENFAERYPSELSGGQRQRVAIAASLMLSPELLIADEPISALDVTIQAQIIELLMKLHCEMGLSILFISHDLRVVYRMCDRVMIMKQGEIVEKGNVQDVYCSPKHEYTQTLLEAAGII